MKQLAGTALRAAGLYALALAVALALSLWRIGALAEDAPLGLFQPFVKPLLSAAFELSLLLGVPGAAAYAWARSRERPGSQGRYSWMIPGGALALVSIAGAVLTDVGTRAPGRLVQELLDAGRESCGASVARRVEVPLVAVAWSCPSGGPATVSGKTPSFGAATFQASDLRVSEDLRRLDLSDARVTVAPSKTRIGATVTARRAKITGLPAWGRPRHVSLELRLAFFTLAVMAVVGATALVASRLRLGTALVFVSAALSGVVLVLMQQALDRAGAAPLAYLALMPVGAAAAALCAAVLRAVRRGVAVAGAGDRW